jgi:ferredoxin
MSTKISIVNVKNYDSILDAIKAGIRLIADSLPISCLCCMEMCPQEAIKPKLRGFGGLFHSY